MNGETFSIRFWLNHEGAMADMYAEVDATGMMHALIVLCLQNQDILERSVRVEVIKKQ